VTITAGVNTVNSSFWSTWLALNAEYPPVVSGALFAQ
jgi:hypothetical protein